MQLFAYGTGPRTNQSAYQLHGASVHLDDSDVPIISSAPTSPGGWTKSAAITTTVNARDGGTAADPNSGGVGMWFTELKVPKRGGGTVTLVKAIDFNDACGARISRCRRDFTATFTYSTDDADGAGPGTDAMPEGVNTVGGTAKDLLNKPADFVSPTTVKVDRTQPTVDLATVGWAEDDDETLTVYAAVNATQYTVEVDADDAASGVGTVALYDSTGGLVDIETTVCSPQCPTNPDPLALSEPVGSLNESQLYSAKVTDAAGNTSTIPVRLVADRVPPSAPSEPEVMSFADGVATIGWDALEDPQLAGDLEGSGVDRAEYRFRRSIAGEYSPWMSTEEGSFDLPASLAELITVEVQQVDHAGNRSAVLTESLVILPPAKWTPGPDPGGGPNVIDVLEEVALFDGTPTEDLIVPRVGELVTLESPSGNTYQQTTDWEGKAAFREVPDGTYTVSYGDDREHSQTVTVGGVNPSQVRIAEADRFRVTTPNKLYCSGVLTGSPRVIAARAMICGSFQNDVEEAEFASSRLFVDEDRVETDGSRLNAFKHAYWTAQMVRSIRFYNDNRPTIPAFPDPLPGIDVSDAEKFAHDFEDGWQDRSDYRLRRLARLDLHNDTYGYDIAEDNPRFDDRALCRAVLARNRHAKKPDFKSRSSTYKVEPKRHRLLFTRTRADNDQDGKGDASAPLIVQQPRSHFGGTPPCIKRSER